MLIGGIQEDNAPNCQPLKIELKIRAYRQRHKNWICVYQILIQTLAHGYILILEKVWLWLDFKRGSFYIGSLRPQTVASEASLIHQLE